jgi:hypothetical protein
LIGRLLGLHEMRSIDDGGGAIGILLRGGPGDEGQAHDPEFLPVRTGSKARAFLLDAIEDLAGERRPMRIAAA